jgi:DNA-binding transcriptional regulator YhcF (GntR family)
VRYHGVVDLRVDREAEVPLGTQLAWKLRRLIESGDLGAGDRLPSVRDAAAAAGVNVNTVRSVYGRLEREGLVSSQHGRGTFVRAAEPALAEDAELTARRDLRRQIARLEAELARRPPPPTEAGEQRRHPAPGGTLLSAEQLENVRDDLLTRLHELDEARAEVVRRLDELPAGEQSVVEWRPSRSTSSLAGARVRWVGA